MLDLLNPFEFMLPTTIKYGENIYTQIPEELKNRGRKHPMIISGKTLVKTGGAKKITDVLEAEGFSDIPVFSDVEPNPRDTTVEKIAAIAREHQVDSLIALGGGSPMDAAKGAGILLSNGGKIKDYEGLGLVKNKIPTLFAIPTTVGTGSEVTFWAVIKDTKENYKLSIGSPLIAPEIAFVDPTFIETLPGAIIASTGMDALTHAIEGYTCKIAEPITDACGLYAIKLIGDNIRNAVYTDQKEAKAGMLIGSLIAGICFGNSDVGGCHCMSEALGGLYDTPHGIANAIMLPYIMEFNYVADLEKFSQVAEALGINTRTLSRRQAALAAVKAVQELNEDLEIPNLKEIGAKEEDIDELSMRAATNVSVEDNPRPITQSDFKNIFSKAFCDPAN